MTRFAEKEEECPHCGEVKQWLYDAQICDACGYGNKVLTRRTDDCRTQRQHTMRRLLTAAKLLQANAIGCVQNHFSKDYAQQRIPGWLADTQADIEAAEAFIAKAEGKDNG